MTPAALSLLLVHVKKHRRSASAGDRIGIPSSADT
jgi:hypothetical protein